MSRHNSSHLSRRALLKHLGLGAAALPFLKFGKRAEAHAGTAPQRLVLFPSMNGADPSLFWPNPSNLSAMSPVTQPLRAFQNKMTFIRGINVEGSFNHFAVRSIFTGASVPDYLSPDPTVKSLDQVVADQFQATAPATKKSIHLGAIPADSIEFYQLYGRSTFFFSNGPVDYEANPVTAFDRLFGSNLTARRRTLAALTPDETIENAVLGIAEAELGSLGSRLQRSPRESAKVANHLDAVRSLRHADTGGGNPPGGGGDPPDGGGGNPPAAVCSATALQSVEKLRPELQGNAAGAYQHRLFSDLMDAQWDIIARSIVCGLTRVATLQAGSADNNVIVPVDGGYPHHLTSHGDQNAFARVQAWYADKLARFLTQLNVPDPLDPNGGTVLDNTCVVWLAECLPQSHGSDSVPCFIVGGGAGTLKTGAFIDGSFSNKALLKTIARALGVSDGASSHFGSNTISQLLR